jgi:hypothetical protein
MLIDLDDRVHCAADQTAELLLALAHLRLDAQPAQFGRGAGGKDLK